MESTSHCKIAPIFLALATLVFAIQAIYWPYIQGPQGLNWWQFSWMAEFGIYVGWPVVIITELTGSEIAAWIAAILWAMTIWMLARIACSKIFD